MNIVDAASSFQALVVLERKTCKEVVVQFENAWVNWAGAPVTIVADMGPEFVGEEFVKWAEFHGSRLYHTPVEAPWQNGAAERAGQTAKIVIAKIVKEHGLIGPEFLKMAVSAATAGLNDDVGESGFSPAQWVLGRAPRRFPSVLGPGGAKRAAHSAADTEATFSKRVALMETARLAVTRVKFNRKLRRALLARTRPPAPALDLRVGDIVYFFRKQARQGGAGKKKGKLVFNTWRGPGVLVGIEGNTGMFIGYRGYVTKCAPESVRKATSMEQLCGGLGGCAARRFG